MYSSGDRSVSKVVLKSGTGGRGAHGRSTQKNALCIAFGGCSVAFRVGVRLQFVSAPQCSQLRGSFYTYLLSRFASLRQARRDRTAPYHRDALSA